MFVYAIHFRQNADAAPGGGQRRVDCFPTDNAAMIAWAGIEKLKAGAIDPDDLVARPRWPLDTSRPALLGSGKKGAKA